MYVLLPSPQTVLDQLPRHPRPHQVARLAEALYLVSKDYAEATFPPTYYQLGDCACYQELATYLVQRRQRPEFVDPAPEQRRARAWSWLTEQVINYPGELTDAAGQLTPSSVLTFLQGHYRSDPAEVLRAWAQRWLDNPPPTWPDWYWWKKELITT